MLSPPSPARPSIRGREVALGLAAAGVGLALAPDDRVFYRIVGPDGGTITGYEDLPPPAAQGDEMTFYSADYSGETVRLAHLRDLLVNYGLEVSSPGPERPLTKPDHFRRFIGRRARVRRVTQRSTPRVKSVARGTVRASGPVGPVSVRALWPLRYPCRASHRRRTTLPMNRVLVVP